MPVTASALWFFIKLAIEAYYTLKTVIVLTPGVPIKWEPSWEEQHDGYVGTAASSH